jgi:hypothetical protein
MASKRELLAIAKLTGWIVEVKKSANARDEWVYAVHRGEFAWYDFGFESYIKAKRAGYIKLAEIIKKLGEQDGI